MAGRTVFWSAGEYDDVDGERKYIPSLVTENVQGHSPMRGGNGQMPYYWGSTHEECQRRCESANEKSGISEKEALDIVSSTMGF